MLADRYRIIGLLGRGGMGEVYRADDLKLGQSVALKFLPVEVERDEGRLQRFLNEVRMALKVTHPNVTRVYDIGEVDGHHFISMEYVDGEDLSSLLTRIGRLPKDKAVQVARQICAGLAAAHDQGVLHRDLKPANVMLDGRGRAKITDFGLAGLDETIKGAEARAGTPAYMAPEQWAGKEVTVQSDLYALGLVLYELFTGQAVYSGKTPAEILKLQQESSPTTPSSVVEGFDPSVERLILKCLEKSPGSRPKSALAVAAALPGGDPLAAALAAGETPSPELVAQAGAVGGLKSWVAGLCVALVVLGVGISFWIAGEVQMVRLAPLERPPDFLAARAQELLADLGYQEAPGDLVYAFEPNSEYQEHLRGEGLTGSTWDRMRSRQPAIMTFKYRQSPSTLMRISTAAVGAWMDDPPSDRPGMIRVDLDPSGRLLHMTAVPWESAPENTVAEPQWDLLLEAAGFEIEAFEPTKPTWNPPFFADSQRAWLGSYPEADQIPIRVEAAGLGDKVTWFRVIEPWIEPVVPGVDAGLDVFGTPVVFLAWFIVVLLLGGVLAWRNLRLGRGDRKGAFRTAVFFGVVRMTWLLAADHIPGGQEIEVLTGHIAYSAYRVCLIWIFYIALEPYARRLWPHMLTSWFRLLNGQFRDPLVGRDILVGVAVSAAGGWLVAGQLWATFLLDREMPDAIAALWSLVSLRGGPHILGAVGGELAVSIWELFMVVILFLLLKLLVRKTWIALSLQTLLMIAIFMGPGDPVLNFLVNLCFIAIFWWLLFRFGLLSALVLFTVGNLLGELPLTHDFSAWYAGSTWMTLLVIAGLTAWGFYVALAGRPVFKDDLFTAEESKS